MPRKKKGVLPSGSVRVQVYDYTDDSGKRHYQSFTAATRAEAQALAEDWKRSRMTLKEKLTVSTAIARYIELKAAVLSPSAVRNYKVYARQYFSGSFGAKDLRGLQNADIQLWVSDLTGHNLRPKTVRNAYGLLTAALALFLPGFRPSVTLPAKMRTEFYCPSLDDIMTLCRSTPDPYLRCAILLGSVGAMRRGEICAGVQRYTRGHRDHRQGRRAGRKSRCTAESAKDLRELSHHHAAALCACCHRCAAAPARGQDNPHQS